MLVHKGLQRQYAHSGLVHIQLDVTKSPKSEKWSAAITQSSRALPWYAVEYFNLHFSLTGKLLGSFFIRKTIPRANLEKDEVAGK